MWEWLKNLWNNARSLVSRVFEAFLNWIIHIIEVIYSAFIMSFITLHFPYFFLLYVIFYVEYGEAFMEVWNPRGNQSSKRIKLERAPSGVSKPNRNEAEVFQATS